MSELVTLTHPDLPGQSIRIPASRVAPRLGAGWEITEPEPAPEIKKPQRRRRTTETEDQ